MNKSTSKLIVPGVLLLFLLITSCRTNSGYGCDYTEATKPTQMKPHQQNIYDYNIYKDEASEVHTITAYE